MAARLGSLTSYENRPARFCFHTEPVRPNPRSGSEPKHRARSQRAGPAAWTGPGNAEGPERTQHQNRGGTAAQLEQSGRFRFYWTQQEAGYCPQSFTYLETAQLVRLNVAVLLQPQKQLTLRHVTSCQRPDWLLRALLRYSTGAFGGAESCRWAASIATNIFLISKY